MFINGFKEKIMLILRRKKKFLVYPFLWLKLGIFFSILKMFIHRLNEKKLFWYYEESFFSVTYF